MYSKKNKMTILVCYELNSGGESVAIERLFEEYEKLYNAEIDLVSSKKLRSKGSLLYFMWLINNVFFWMFVIWKNRRANWICTPLFTAGFAASLLKPFFGYKICFNHQGSRMPSKSVDIGVFKNFVHLIKYKLTYWMHKVFFSNLDLLLILSEFSKKKLISQFPILEEKTIHFIHNGVDVSYFRPLSSSNKTFLREKYKTKDKYVLLYVGRLNKIKRVKLLLKVLIRLCRTIPNILLIVAHPTTSTSEENIYKKELLDYSQRNNLEKYIKWHENKKNIFELYNISDLTVLLSKEDNFPLVMLESLACKSLFMSTPNGAMREVLEQIDLRFLLNTTNPREISKRIKSTLKLPEKQKQMLRSKGYKLAKEFSWKRASGLVDEYLREF